MAAVPQTVYARDGDVHLAYQVGADRGSDLLFVPTATFPIDLLWDDPTVAGHLRRLASFSRLIMTDLLGMGSSDAVPIQNLPAMQAWRDGLVAVLDAVGTECASVFAMGESALPAMLLAASHPQRVRSLVLWSPYARFLRADDYPCGMPEPTFTRYVDAFGEGVGTGAVVDTLAPSWAGDAGKRRWWARGERLAGGPGYFKAIFDLYLRTDVRPALDSIQAPTLLLHRRDDRHVSAAHVRYLAERIPKARLVEFDGDDHVWFAGDTDRVLDEIESFVTGDGALATFDGPARAITCACAIRDAVQDLGLDIRAGLHTGEVEMIGRDVHGIAVHIAARIMALAGPGEVLVSGVIPPLVLGSRIGFDDRGSHPLKGVRDPWPVLAVRDERG